MHKKSNPIFSGKNKKNIIYLLSAESVHRILSFNILVSTGFGRILSTLLHKPLQDSVAHLNSSKIIQAEMDSKP